MLVPPIRCAGLGGGCGEPAAMHILQCPRHSDPRQRPNIDGVSLLEEIRNVTRGDGVADQPRFQPAQPEGRQHQQCRDEGHKQQRHKSQVNTPKISAGSRITYAVERDSG